MKPEDEGIERVLRKLARRNYRGSLIASGVIAFLIAVTIVVLVFSLRTTKALVDQSEERDAQLGEVQQATADWAASTREAIELIHTQNPRIRMPKLPPPPEPLQGGNPAPLQEFSRPTPVAGAAPTPSRRHKSRPAKPKQTFWQWLFTPRNSVHIKR